MHGVIPPTFIQYAADILGDTNDGLSGTNIIRLTTAYAVEYDVELPYAAFPSNVANKRTVLFKNLMAFTPEQQYRIIKELCEHHSLPSSGADKRTTLKVRRTFQLPVFRNRFKAVRFEEKLESGESVVIHC